MSSVKTDGSQTCTIGTEHTLATVTDAGIYQLNLDLNAMADGDIIEVRLYGKVRVGGTERQIGSKTTYGATRPEGQQTFLPAIISPHHFKATIKQIAGTGRAIPWAIYATGA